MLNIWSCAKISSLKGQENDVLEVSLFGSPVLKLDQTALCPPTKKALGIIAYLAINGECSREQLAKLFWSSMGDERARRNLRQEL